VKALAAAAATHWQHAVTGTVPQLETLAVAGAGLTDEADDDADDHDYQYKSVGSGGEDWEDSDLEGPD
jgi:hypothetical protein